VPEKFLSERRVHVRDLRVVENRYEAAALFAWLLCSAHWIVALLGKEQLCGSWSSLLF